MAEARKGSPEVQAYVARLRVHHRRLYGGGSTPSGSGHTATHSSHAGVQHGGAPQQTAPSQASGTHGEPVVRLGGDVGSGQGSPALEAAMTPPANFQSTVQGQTASNDVGASAASTTPQPSGTGQSAPASDTAISNTPDASAGGLVPAAHPTDQQVKDADSLLRSKLAGAKGLVLSNVVNSYAEYHSFLEERAKAVEAKIAKQEATKNLVVEVVLTIPFFFAGPLVDAAAAKIATKIGPILGKDLGEEGLAAVEKNIEGASKKVGEEILKTSKKELAKSFKVGTDRQNGRLLYIKNSISAIDASRKALVKEINGASDVAALALVLAAVLSQDQATFGQEFEKMFSDWSEKELPRLIQEATPQLDLTQMGP